MTGPSLYTRLWRYLVGQRPDYAANQSSLSLNSNAAEEDSKSKVVSAGPDLSGLAAPIRPHTEEIEQELNRATMSTAKVAAEPAPTPLEGLERSEVQIPTLYDLFSVGRGRVFVAPDGRLQHRLNDEFGSGPPVIVYAPRSSENYIFMIALAENLTAISVDSDELRAEVLSYVKADAGGDHVFLKHPRWERFICAGLLDHGQPIDLSCNRQTTGGWERLQLRQTNEQLLPRRVKRIVEVLELLFESGVSTGGAGDWILSTERAPLRATIGAVFRLGNPVILQEVADRVAKDADLRAEVIAALPDDEWRSEFLPRLERWLRARDPIDSLVLGPEYDFLVTRFASSFGMYSAGAILNSIVRRTVEPRQKLAVIATARNEGIYFLEWIAHYRTLGVEHFFIYSNDNNDNSDVLLKALADNKVITWISNSFAPGIDGQMKAYAHCLSCVPQVLDYEWSLIVDLDEFVIVDKGRWSNLLDFVQAREATGAVAVSLSWIMFDTGGNLRWSSEPLLARNLSRTRDRPTEVKTMFQTRFFISSFPHDPVPAVGTTVTYHNAAGRLHHWEGRGINPSNGVPHYEDAWVNHYYFKSIDEWIWKVSRNRGGYLVNTDPNVDLDKVLSQLFWIDAARDTFENGGLEHVDAVRSEFSRLRHLPAIGEAEAQVLATFGDRMSTLRDNVRDQIAQRIERTSGDECERLRAALERLCGGQVGMV